jgi:hypothetical protein
LAGKLLLSFFERRGGMRSKAFLLMGVLVLFCGTGMAATAYLDWTASMSSAESSDLGGYPAVTAFDSTFGTLGWRGDWTYAIGSAQGDEGFQLRIDGHGMWHSGASGSYTSPANVSCQEWIAADFGSVQTILGADIWNINTYYWERGVKDASISVSADGTSWTTVWSGQVAPADGTLPDLMYDGVTYVNPNLEPGHDPQYGRLYDYRADFGGEVDAQYVVINIFNQHGLTYGDYIALDEVKFIVPEPATMTLLGLGLVLLRKRR